MYWPRNDLSLMIEKTLTICNIRGLHARASAKFVKCVENYNAEVTVSRDGSSVGGTSIMGLMMLAAAPGCTIDVTATGVDAENVMQALGDLVADKFGEDE